MNEDWKVSRLCNSEDRGSQQREPERLEYTWKGLQPSGRRSAHCSRELLDSETQYIRGLESNMGCKFVDDL